MDTEINLLSYFKRLKINISVPDHSAVCPVDVVIGMKSQGSKVICDDRVLGELDQYEHLKQSAALRIKGV